VPIAPRVRESDEDSVSQFHQGPRHKPQAKSGSMAAIFTFSPSSSDRLANRGRPSMGTGLRLLRWPESPSSTHTSHSSFREQTFSEMPAQRSGSSARSDAPEAPRCIASHVGSATSVDDLIRPLQQRPWNLEAQCVGSSLIDDEVDLGGLLDGEIRRLGTP
jgi:hypothetical protein